MASARILLVEDEFIIAMGLRMALRNFGYEVAAHASSGTEAVRLVEETNPNLFLMRRRGAFIKTLLLRT